MEIQNIRIQKQKVKNQIREKNCLVKKYFNTEKGDISSVILKVSLMLISLVIYGILLFGRKILTVEYVIPNVILFFATGFFAFLLIRFLNFHPPLVMSRKKENIFLGVVSVLVLAVQVFLTYNIIFRTSWDVAAVWYGSHWVSMGDAAGIQEMSEYYSIYPNNLLLVFIFSRILKLNMMLGNHISNGGLLLAWVQCVVINISGAILYKCAKRFVSIRASWCAYILYTILVGLSGWIVIPYSDGMGVIFPILLLYLYIRYKECTKQSNKYLFILFLFISGAIAYHIKPYTVIVLIAVVIIEGFEFLKTIRKQGIHSMKRALNALLVAIIGMMCSLTLITVATHYMGFSINAELERGIPHYLMLGANVKTWGGFSEEDLAFGNNLNKKLRNQEELKEFVTRLSNMGIGGYAELFIHKAAKNFLDGTYGWESAESFYTEIYPSRGGLCDVLRSWYYGFGDLYKYNAVIRQFLWIMILLLVPSIAYSRKTILISEKVLILAVLGLMLYLQIFESHARYVLTFVPLYIILALMGEKIQEEKKLKIGSTKREK